MLRPASVKLQGPIAVLNSIYSLWHYCIPHEAENGGRADRGDFASHGW